MLAQIQHHPYPITTPSILVSIATKAKPYVEGSLSFYLASGGDEELFAVTSYFRRRLFHQATDSYSWREEPSLGDLPGDGTIAKLRAGYFGLRTMALTRSKLVLLEKHQGWESCDATEARCCKWPRLLPKFVGRS
jgi:hypothetical protein